MINAPKPAALAALFLLATTLVARASAEDRLEKSFAVDPGGQLTIELDRGSVEVTGSADAKTVEIVIDRKVTWRTEAKAREILESHHVDFSQDGNTVKVKGRLENQKLFSGWFGGGNLQIHCKVTVPQKFNAELSTAGGSIKVSVLTGDTKANTSGGSLHFQSITGPIRGGTSGGSIHVSESTGSVAIKTSGGSINLKSVEGDVEAGTSGGSINVQSTHGKLALRTSGGGIHLQDLVGPVNARTSGGSIQASFTEPPPGDCHLETSGGGITVELPSKAAVTVDASTSGGRVSSDLPVTTVVKGEAKSRHLQGTINGGGPKLTARTSGGSVHLKAR